MSGWPFQRSPRIEQWDYEDHMESLDAGIFFDVRVHITATREPNCRLDPELAAAAILRRHLERATRRYTVLRRHAALEDIHASLINELPVTTAGVTVQTATVALMVSDDARRSAQSIEHATSECSLDAIARRQTLARMNFLRDECFNNPAAARIYLMLEYNARIGGPGPYTNPEDLVKEIARWHPESRWISVAEIVTTFVQQLTPGQENDLLKILISATTTLGRPGLAAELERVVSQDAGRRTCPPQ